jgi:hypothetical protein
MSEEIDLLARVQSLEKKVEWMHCQLDVCEMILKNARDKAQERDRKRDNLIKRVKALEEAFKYAIPSDLWPR